MSAPDTAPDGRPIPDWITDPNLRESIRAGLVDLPDLDGPPLTIRRIVALDALLAAVSAGLLLWGRHTWRSNV